MKVDYTILRSFLFKISKGKQEKLFEDVFATGGEDHSGRVATTLQYMEDNGLFTSTNETDESKKVYRIQPKLTSKGQDIFYMIKDESFWAKICAKYLTDDFLPFEIFEMAVKKEFRKTHNLI